MGENSFSGCLKTKKCAKIAQNPMYRRV